MGPGPANIYFVPWTFCTGTVMFLICLVRSPLAPGSLQCRLPLLLRSRACRNWSGDGRADAIQHGRRTREGLEYWLRQSERLQVARTRHGLSGGRFVDFARRIAEAS